MRLFFVAIIAALLSSNANAQVNPDIVAPNCVRFTPLVLPQPSPPPTSYAMIYSRDCNKILIGDKIETVPPAVGVLSGGVQMNSKDVYIGKVPHQAMQAGITYYSFAFCASYNPACDMQINLEPQVLGPNHPLTGIATFSTGHMSRPDYGHEIAVVNGNPDRTQTLVGMVRLMYLDLIAAGTGQQPTTSWNSAGHTALVFNMGKDPSMPPGSGQPTLKVCRVWTGSAWVQRNFMIDANGAEIVGAPPPSLEWLSFGINNQMTQAYTVPNVKFDGIVTTDTTGVTVQAWLTDPAGNVISNPSGYYTQSTAYPAGYLSAVVAGREPAIEGYAKVTLKLSVSSGCATIFQGAIHAELWS